MTIVRGVQYKSPDVSKSLLDRLKSENKFSDAACIKALYYTGNQSLSEAAYWIFHNMDDPELNDYLKVPVPVVIGYLCDACVELYGISVKLPSSSALDSHVSMRHKKGRSSWFVCGRVDCVAVVRCGHRCLHGHGH